MNTFARRLAVPLLLLASMSGAAAAPTVVPPDSPQIQYRGRFDVSDPAAAVFGWPSTAIVARFSGSSLKARLGDARGKNFLQVSIDRQPARSLALAAGEAVYTLASGLPEGPHEVEIVKRTEGYFGSVRFLGFELDSGAALLDPPPRPTLKIEFYGDSNTAGYSSESIANLGLARYENNALAYPGLTARMLGAEIQCMGWSGATIAPGSALPVQGFWDRLRPEVPGSRWDFTRFDADVVVINVGSNDSYNGDNRSGVMAGWEDLITQHIRRVHPRAHVVLADSYGWSFDEPANYLADMVAKLAAQGDHKVSFVSWPWLWGQTHAVVEEQAGFANVLAPHIARQLGLSDPAPNTLSSFGGAGELYNGGFEKAGTGTGRERDAAGWRRHLAGDARSALLMRGQSAHSGAGLIELAVGPAGGKAVVWQAMPVEPGRRYTVSGYARGTAGQSARLGLVFKDQGQNVIGASQVPVVLGKGWALHTTSAVAPPGAWSVNVTLELSGIRKVARFDDLALKADAPGCCRSSATDRRRRT